MKKLFSVLTFMLVAIAVFADKTGKCGDNATWSLNESTGALTISGSGKIFDYDWGESPFYEKPIKTVNISNGITSIGACTFLGCDELTSVTMANTITSIGDDAFESCFQLKSITLPTSLATIGEYAFSMCPSLTSITIPKSVKVIDPSALSYTPKLSSIVIESGNSVYDSRNNCNAIIETKTNKLVLGCQKSTIPSTVTTIGNSAFQGCEGLQSISIPSSVKTIESYAFYICSNLTSITIPKSVTNIGIGVFEGCYSLNSMKVETGNSVYDSRNNCNAIIETKTNTLLFGCNKTVIPNGVTTIGANAFSYSNLTSITIPATVKTIEEYAFEMCENLTSITIPKATTYISDRAFTYCTNLATIKVEAGNTTYDSRNDCNAIILTKQNKIIRGGINTTIPNTITSIGENAFSNCTDMTSIVIPSSVTTIAENSFDNCYGLESIYAMSPTPPSVGENTFYSVDKSTCILYVPKTPSNAVSLYRSAAVWNEFENIRAYDPNPTPADVNGDGNINSADVVSVYNYIIDGEESGIPASKADVNRDGNINAADVVAIYNYIITGE